MTKNSHTFDDPVVLEAALEGLELQRSRIEAQIKEIRSRLGKRPRKSLEAPAAAQRRILSPEAHKRIAAAQRKRWAEYRKTNVNSR
jgi:predicted  nucleic acid-binding Zn-ribbon protein